MGSIACHGQQWFLGRNLLQQQRHHSCVADVVGGDKDRSYLQSLGIDADMQFAPLVSAFRSMLFALSLAFVQEFDACGVNPQLLSRLRWRRHNVL